MYGPVCYIRHQCAISDSATRRTANLMAVKYPAQLSVWELSAGGAFDGTRDMEGKNLAIICVHQLESLFQHLPE